MIALVHPIGRFIRDFAAESGLKVSASYLMYLTDSREGKTTKAPGMGALIPLLDYKQATEPLSFFRKSKKMWIAGLILSLSVPLLVIALEKTLLFYR